MENVKKWKSGDVVRLKSGGPKMTVDRYVTCYEPAYDGEACSLSAIGGAQKKVGEDVKCVFFQTPPGGTQPVYPVFTQVHEDCLEGIDLVDAPVFTQHRPR